jgi:DNA-binding CsgD family transcriptional regulator
MATRRTGERVTLSGIRETYFDGDYEVCLTMCDRFQQRDATDAAEIVLLRARCLIQLDRGDEALEAVRGLRIADDQHDEYITSRMLMSAAYMSLGRDDDGLEIARKAYDEIGGAHSTVRAELILNLAIAHYRKGEYARTSRLLDEIPDTEDIVYVRALQVRGGVARIQGDPVTALERFREAFARLSRCRCHDRFTEAKLLYSLTYLCAQLPRLDLWPQVSKQIDEFDWSVSGVATLHYWVAIEASFITEMLGDLDGSTAWASLAEGVAADSASLIGAWCRMAACVGRIGENVAHAYLTNKAIQKYDAIPKNARSREQLGLSLDIAEELLHTDGFMRASRLVSYYAEVAAPGRAEGIENRKLESRYATVLGQLEDRRGNRGRAEEAYRRAFEISRSVGLIRSAAIVAYRLFALTGDEQYETFVTVALHDASEKYWVKARLLKSRTEARLTPRQLEVVRLVAQGLSNKEIASTLRISVPRARNIVAAIFAVLGVRSRAELATVAAARGLAGSE